MRALVFEPFDDLTVLHVCRRMRRVDAEEVFAMRPDDDAFALYRDMAALGGRHLWFDVVRPADSIVPIAMFGVVASSPGNGIAHMVATDALTLSDAGQIAHRVQTVLKPVMLQAGLHRVEALSLASHTWAHRFLRQTGARAEGPIRPGLGKRGEAFQTFVWLKSELPHEDPRNLPAEADTPIPAHPPAGIPVLPHSAPPHLSPAPIHPLTEGN